MKTTLVTGGCGFIGSHLCEALVGRGNFVIAVDNLLSGSQKNIAHLLSKKLIFIEHDVIEPLKLGQKYKNIDDIYHLASPAAPNANSPYS